MTTPMDFMAVLSGLPEQKGTQPVEEELKTFIEEETGQKVVGVSVCWNISEDQEELLRVCEDDMALRDGKEAARPATSKQNLSCYRRSMNGVDSLVGMIFGIPDEAGEETDSVGKPRTPERLVKDLMTTSEAFVIFESESARDQAVAHRQGILQYRGNLVTLMQREWEPGGVLWETMHIPLSARPLRLCVCMLAMTVILMIWFFAFFLPSARYLLSFRNGEEPSTLNSTLFTALVILGNQVVYFVSDAFAGMVGFRFEDNRQAVYVILYTSACMMQVVLDLAMCGFMSYQRLVELGVRTEAGVLIGDLTDVVSVFEAYGMQRELGSQLEAYAIYGTFLVPFILEPIFCIAMPLYIKKLIVQSKAYLTGRDAERAMEFFVPFDLSRYGDLLLNIFLAACVVFYPTGFMMKIFVAMALSGCVIYLVDHYRILRGVPDFNFSVDRVDCLAQCMLAFPVATLLAGYKFKSNCTPGNACVKGDAIITHCFAWFFAHVILHCLLVKFVVPPLADCTTHHEESRTSYAEAAKWFPCNFFTKNPAHCARSIHFYRHNPPCIYHQPGKEHLQKMNTQIGLYYQKDLLMNYSDSDADSRMGSKDSAPRASIGNYPVVGSRQTISQSSTYMKQDKTRH
jgi:hypothetical protein